MTVVKQSTGVIRLGNGAATSFTFPFGAGSPSDIKLYLLDENDVGTEVPSNQYSVTLNQADETGTLTTNFPDGPLPIDGRIFIGRETDNTQTVIVNSQTAYDPAVVMRVWDKLTRLVQELRYDVNRAAKVPIGQFDPDGIYAEELSANLSRLVSISDDISRVASVDTHVAAVSPNVGTIITATTLIPYLPELQNIYNNLVAIDGVYDRLPELVTIYTNLATILAAAGASANLAGGGTGQYLTKASGTDFDYAWSSPIGGGDMLESVFDPNGKRVDVYSMGNMDETATAKIMTAAERTAVAGAVRHDVAQTLTVAARNRVKTSLGITISASAPSGGEDGDIWFQY